MEEDVAGSNPVSHPKSLHKMSKQQISKFSKILFVINTSALVILLEVLIWKIPYVSIFILIFGLVYYLNLQVLLCHTHRAGKIVNRSQNRGNQKPDSQPKDY